MAKPLDPIIEEVLNRYDIDPRRALWDCHGTWVIYHKYVELIGMKAGVTLDAPSMIHSDPVSRLRLTTTRTLTRSPWLRSVPRIV